MSETKRYVKVVPGSKKSKDLWESFRPDKSQTGDWAGRSWEDACSNGDNVALLTGWGLYVIDVDTKNGDGIKNWQAKKMQYNLPDTYTVKTPSGGFHFYYSVPKDAGLRNSAFWGEHIDSRGDGGYVLCPPSVLDYVQGDGSVLKKSYEVFNNTAVVDLPKHLIYEIKQHRKEGKDKITSLGFNFDASDNIIHKGSRDNTLTSIAGKLVQVLPIPSVEAIMPMIRDVYFAHCENPDKTDWKEMLNRFPSSIQGWIEDRKNRVEARKLQATIGSKTIDLSELATEYLKNQPTVKKFPTTIINFDTACNGGPSSSDLGLIIARTKTGKTSILLDLTYRWAKQGFNVLFLEMEMSVADLQYRLQARHTGISYWDFINWDKTAKNVLTNNLETYKAITSHIDLVVEPVSLIAAEQLEEIVARREYITGKTFDIICVDYAGQLDGNGDKFWEKANTVARVLRAYNLSNDKLLMTAVQSNRDTKGVDIFSTVAGGDGLARAATWQLFVDRVRETTAVLDTNGNVKKNKAGQDVTTPSKDFMRSSVNVNGNILDGGILKCDLRGRSVLEYTGEIPFAHTVCAFDDAAQISSYLQP